MAEEPAQQEATAAPTRTRWYGSYTLAVDGVSLGLAGLSIQALPPSHAGFTSLGLVDNFLGGPIHHGFHGNSGRAVASVALRVAGPLFLGSALALASGCDGTENDDVRCLLGSALMGGVVAALIDGLALARDEVPVEPESSGFSLTVAPGPASVLALGTF